MRYNPDAESCIFRTSFIHIILSDGCLNKQGHYPLSRSGKDAGCFHTVLSDVNLKLYVFFLRNLSFSESRQNDL